MTRWLVVFDDNVFETETAREAVEEAAEMDQVTIDSTVYVVDLDAVSKTEHCHRMRLGAYPIGDDE